ncbi:MAG: response regulator transcription factor [bacterium]
MERGRIFVVEDDRRIANLVKYNLERAGFECTVAASGEELFRHLDTQPADLIVLDIMLPRMDGFEVCRLLKRDKGLARIPVLMLTAKGEEVDRIVGFELGADDYVVKPFSPRELVLRVKAILKRGTPKDEPAKDILTASALTVDIPRHKVTVNDTRIDVTPMEFKLLLVLMSRRGRVQSRDTLLNDVWDMSADVTTRTIDTHIKRLRQKLGDMGKLIETVRGLGYRFNEEA